QRWATCRFATHAPARNLQHLHGRQRRQTPRARLCLGRACRRRSRRVVPHKRFEQRCLHRPRRRRAARCFRVWKWHLVAFSRRRRRGQTARRPRQGSDPRLLVAPPRQLEQTATTTWWEGPTCCPLNCPSLVGLKASSTSFSVISSPRFGREAHSSFRLSTS